MALTFPLLMAYEIARCEIFATFFKAGEVKFSRGKEAVVTGRGPE